MQIISAQYAVSFYPLATFAQRRSLIMRTKRNTITAIHKYALRGWEMLDEDAYLRTGIDNGYQWSDYGGRSRHVGDRFCWTITLLPPSSDSDSNISADHDSMSWLFMNSWRLDAEIFQMRFHTASQCSSLGPGLPSQLLVDVGLLRKFHMLVSKFKDESTK